MGSNMARRLKDCGYTIAVVYDSIPELTESVADELGACPAKKVSEVSASSEIIFTVVSDDAAMAAIFDDPEDSLFNDAVGKLIINCATISPRVHMELAAKGESHGVDILEAPMASSIPQAREGTLFMMLAGKDAVYQRAEPVLKDMTTAMRYIGPAGSAAQLKALVNMVMNINTTALAEGLGLADALGLDLQVVMDVFAQTGANSRVLQTDGEDMVNRDHETYFSVAHAAKDSGIAVQLAREAGLVLPLAQATLAQYSHLTALGSGHIDKSGVSELTFKGRQADKAQQL